jgi:hypothetical protein
VLCLESLIPPGASAAERAAFAATHYLIYDDEGETIVQPQAQQVGLQSAAESPAQVGFDIARDEDGVAKPCIISPLSEQVGGGTLVGGGCKHILYLTLLCMCVVQEQGAAAAENPPAAAVAGEVSRRRLPRIVRLEPLTAIPEGISASARAAFASANHIGYTDKGEVLPVFILPVAQQVGTLLPEGLICNHQPTYEPHCCACRGAVAQLEAVVTCRR